MDTFFVFLVILLIVLAIRSGLRAKYESELLEKNPAAWQALQADKEQKKQKNRETVGNAVGSAFQIAAEMLKRRAGQGRGHAAAEGPAGPGPADEADRLKQS